MRKWKARLPIGRGWQGVALWNKDPTLWTNSGEEKWLGWLDVVDQQVAAKQDLKDFAAEVKARRFANILLLGMGGSSLCPEVLQMTFGAPTFHVLDSTDPAQVKAFENKVDLDNTLFFVSSKSGSTLEPNTFKQYFFDRAKRPDNFVAITDPGRIWRRSRRATSSGRSSMGCRVLVDATRRCRTSEWLRRRRWGSIWIASWECSSDGAGVPESGGAENPGVLLGRF